MLGRPAPRGMHALRSSEKTFSEGMSPPPTVPTGGKAFRGAGTWGEGAVWASLGPNPVLPVSSTCLPRPLEVPLSIPCRLEVRFSGRKRTQAYTHIGHRVALKDGQSAAWLALPAIITGSHGRRQRGKGDTRAVRPGNSRTTRQLPEYNQCATLTYCIRLLRRSTTAADSAGSG